MALVDRGRRKVANISVKVDCFYSWERLENYCTASENCYSEGLFDSIICWKIDSLLILETRRFITCMILCLITFEILKFDFVFQVIILNLNLRKFDPSKNISIIFEKISKSFHLIQNLRNS